MKIVECSPFFDEKDLLKVKLELLYDYIDQFVICESNYTYSGIFKGYNFLNYQDEFKIWQDKIVYLKFEPTQEELNLGRFNAWDLEYLQRTNYVKNLDDNDVAIFSDLDEIINPEILYNIRTNGLDKDLKHLNMSLYYYYLNCKGVGIYNSNWNSVFLAKVSYIKENNIHPINQRNKPVNCIENAGWHFSYLGGVEKIRNKIKSFSHQELNNDYYTNYNHLLYCIDNGIDYIGRIGYDWKFVDIKEFPLKLYNIIIKYTEFIKTF